MGSLRLWDLESGAQIGDEWRGEGGKERVDSMALSPNGKTVVSGSRDGTVSLWDVETRKVIAKWEEPTTVKSVCWSPDGERVASGFFLGMVKVWDVKSGEPKATKIATGGDNGIEIWDPKTGPSKCKTIKIKFDFYVPSISLAWTSDEKKLISGSTYGSISIFDTATWQQIAVLEGHTKKPVSSITLCSNDRLLASTSWDDTARLWNLDTNLQVGSPLQHEEDVLCAALSADGKLLSTGCGDKIAYVWDIQTILKIAGLEDLLSIPDKALSCANATRRLPIRQVPAGFFDNVQGDNPSSTTSRLHLDPSSTRRRHTFALFWESHPRTLLARLPKFFRYSQPNADEPVELQQRPGPSTSSRRSLPVVEVPALDDKKALYTARRPERASDKAKCIKNPKWWARVVLFLCCASPSTDSSH